MTNKERLAYAEKRLDEAIQHGKEHRKPYRGSKRIDRTCRNHGGCPWCEGNRLHKYKKRSHQDILCDQTEEVDHAD